MRGWFSEPESGGTEPGGGCSNCVLREWKLETRAEGTPAWMLHSRRVRAVTAGAKERDEVGNMRRTSHSSSLLPGMRQSLDSFAGVMIHLMTLARTRGWGVEDRMA